ncbi:hypothetical protein [Facilibium subflavum]|uniref:hypothetical protein n=1 Tax=Facilibium subflavum TaxID=2219058 RepID=UPI000E655B64|nr:hypothetical protein [Facilibium subflavum]
MKQFDFDNDEVIDDKTNQQSLGSANRQAVQSEPEFNEDENAKVGLVNTLLQKLRDSFSIMWVAYAFGGALVLYVIYSVGSLILPHAPQKPPQAQKPAFSQDMFEARQHQVHSLPQGDGQLHQSQQVVKHQPSNSVDAKVMQNVQDTLTSQMHNMQDVLQKAVLILNNNTKKMITSQSETKTEVDSLKNSVAKVQQSLLTLTSYVHQLDEKIDKTVRLSPQLKQISEQLSLLQAEKTNLSDKLALVAVVGNRAWLQDQHGKTVTVSTGDKLDNYGKILKIDDDQERVYTSSGFVFK